MCDNFQRTEGCKIISPHHYHTTNGVRPADSYAILPNEIRLPDVGVDGMEKKSIFEMGYQKVIYLGDDGSTSTNAISYHSREYEWTNVQGKYWDVSSVWKWAPIPNSRYGLSEPKIMTK